MKIIGITRTNSGVDYHRVFLPLRYLPLTEQDMIIFLNEKSQQAEEFFNASDILYINRHIPGYTLESIQDVITKYNLKLVVDLDDFWELYRHHIIYKAWQEGEIADRIKGMMRMANLVITTHEHLANECKEYNPNVEVLPNSLPIGHDQFTYNREEHDKFRILYAGGNSHLHDLKSVGNLFRRLGSDGEFKAKASFVLGGYTNPDRDRNSVWHSMDAVVKKCVSYEHYGAQPVAEYMKMYDGADVSIAPLENNKFNTYKSNLKTIESGSKHLPIIATNIHPYNLDNVQGVTLCSNTAEWYQAIMKYVKNPNLAKEDGEALFEYVNENYNLMTVNKKRYELLKSLL